MKKIKIAPSILSADFVNLAAELREAEKAGADLHHLDVMDGHFVPNLTFGLPIIRAIKQVTSIPLDVHIMISNPDQVATEYVDAGADILSFHIEASTHSHRTIHKIQEKGAKAGIAINPGTSAEALRPVLDYVDVINVMTVNPGFGGQKFIHHVVPKIEQIKQMLQEIGREDKVLIEVDGGVDDKTAPLVVAKGATLLVAGNYVYGAKDRAERIAALKSVAGK
jgi:ribulose-phosphate 3-epimerase